MTPTISEGAVDIVFDVDEHPAALSLVAYTDRCGLVFDADGVCCGVLALFDWEKGRLRPIPALARACVGARYAGAIGERDTPLAAPRAGASLELVGRDPHGRPRSVRTRLLTATSGVVPAVFRGVPGRAGRSSV